MRCEWMGLEDANANVRDQLSCPRDGGVYVRMRD